MNSKFKVLVFKAECQQHPDTYKVQLTAAGYNTRMIPVIDFIFSAMDELKEKLLQPEKYSGIVLTSERSVEAVANVLGSDRKTAMAEWKSHFVLCTGLATRDKISRDLDLIATVGEKQRGEGILDVLIKEKDAIDRPLLYPCGELASAQDTLRASLEENEIQCDVVIVYATVANPELKDILTEILKEDKEDDSDADADADTDADADADADSTPAPTPILVFFSPSGFHAALEVLQSTPEMTSTLETAKFVAIGPTTAAAIKKKEMSVWAEAVEPTAQSLLAAIRQAENASGT